MMNSTPHIGICAAFTQGHEIVSFVLQQGYLPQFVATCLHDESPSEQAIVQLCSEKKIPVFRHISVNDQSFLQILRERNMDAMVLAWWPDIIKQPAIDAVSTGWINLHPSLLPYGQGKHGYYWSIVEGTPFGVSIHFIDSGIDTGPILFQKEIPVSIIDTGEALYKKGVEEVLKLFKKHVKQIMSLAVTPKKQDMQRARYHHSRDIETHSHIHLNSSYNAEELLNIVRGRTFRHGPSAYIIKNNKKYYVRIEIEEAKK